MDKVRIQADLYTHVNQEKLDQMVIPDDKPCVGGFQNIAEDDSAVHFERRGEGDFGRIHLLCASFCKLWSNGSSICL